MIIGTAGHIDHGKTALVRALTGVDTDRLPEEKRRGISIDLGYAYVDGARPGERLGFIDVPGHERLVHTMLAGATGIDHALLVVACDDGVMPQTREHLALLALLRVPSATLVLTKTDRVPRGRVDEVRREARALLASTAFADAPAHAVSSVTGEGLDALKDHLATLQALAVVPAAPGTSRGRGEPAGQAGFRLAVDRAFTLEGLGAVATGTIVAGRVRVGDTLALLPAEGAAPPRLVRVRSLHAQNTPAEEAGRGQRAALALAGVAREDLRRGQWLCDPAVVPPSPPGAAFSPTRRLDAVLRLAPGGDEALRDGTTVHLHLGAEDVMARVDLLDRDRLAPGEDGLVQLVTRTPLAAWWGDRFALRDAAASRTLAGGRVLDPLAPARHRRRDERLALLAAFSRDDPAARWAAALDASPRGLDVDARRRAEGLVAAPPLPPGTARHGALAFSPAAWDALRQAAADALDRFHAQCPDELGPTSERLRRLAGLALDEAAWHGLLDERVREGAFARQGPWFHRPGHARVLGEGERRIAERVLPRLAAAGSEPPWVRDLARDTGTPEETLRAALRRIARHGEIFPVVKDLYFHARALDALARLAGELAARDGEVRAAAFRDASGLGRKRAIQVLEFLDRTGLLRRVGDAHRLRGDPAMFAAAAAATGDAPPRPPPAPPAGHRGAGP